MRVFVCIGTCVYVCVWLRMFVACCRCVCVVVYVFAGLSVFVYV